MVISERLQAIARLVPPCDTVADIGCDHGQLTYLLLQNGTCRHVIACDVREKPLAKAKELLKNESSVSFACCDGLEQAEEAQAAVIAGMGGNTIQGILERGADIARRMKLILQPSTGTAQLRRFLCESGYCITDERVLKDDRFYPLLFAETGETKPFSPLELELGRANVLRRDPVTLEYAAWRLSVYQKTVATPAETERGKQGQRMLQEKIDMLTQFLKEEQA